MGFYRGLDLVKHCGGTLITFRWVLTSAHCLYGEGGRYPYFTHAIVLAGTVNRNYGTLRRSSFSGANWRPHPNYDSTNPDSPTDIALMRVDSAFQLQYYAWFYYLNTICVPEASNVFNINVDEAYFTGYGMIENNVETDWLRVAKFKLLPYTQCHIAGTVCSDYRTQPGQPARPCIGDSGAGLYQNVDVRATLVGPLAGSLQYTPGCGASIYYSDWIAVPLYVPWILDILLT